MCCAGLSPKAARARRWLGAKATDLARIQETFDLVTETQGQISCLGITEVRFKDPVMDVDRLFLEAIMNRVLRITEGSARSATKLLRTTTSSVGPSRAFVIGSPTTTAMWAPILPGRRWRRTSLSCSRVVAHTAMSWIWSWERQRSEWRPGPILLVGCSGVRPSVLLGRGPPSSSYWQVRSLSMVSKAIFSQSSSNTRSAPFPILRGDAWFRFPPRFSQSRIPDRPNLQQQWRGRGRRAGITWYFLH